MPSKSDGKYDYLKNKVAKKYSNSSNSPKGPSKVLVVFLLGVLLVTSMMAFGVFSPDVRMDDNPTDNWNKYDTESSYEILLYSSPDCSCCHVYVDYLEENGFTVDFRATEQLEDLKIELQIPVEMYSCHTSKIDNYFVEGHIPITAINKLLDDKPTIDGISLPGMPDGSPGMGGEKSDTFEIKSLLDGSVTGTFVEI